MKKYAPVFVVLMLVAFMFTFIHIWLTTPIVQISASSGKCVAVLLGGDCDNLPNRYEVEYVK